MRDFRRGEQTAARIHWKGHSPVTDADLAVDAFLGGKLGATGFAYHSEERPASWRGHAQATTFVVDPIDGTRNFIAGGEAWCIVIGLIHGGHAAAGVVHLPATGVTLSAFRGGGAFLDGKRLLPRSAGPAKLRISGPKSSIETLSHRLKILLEPIPSIPALAHRVLAPLMGSTELALARSGGHDWDIVASDCILSEAGGALLTLAGTPPHYALDGDEQPALIGVPPALLDEIGALLLTNPA